MSDTIYTIIAISIILSMSCIPCCISLCIDIYMCCVNDINDNYHLPSEIV